MKSTNDAMRIVRSGPPSQRTGADAARATVRHVADSADTWILPFFDSAYCADPMRASAGMEK